MDDTNILTDLETRFVPEDSSFEEVGWLLSTRQNHLIDRADLRLESPTPVWRNGRSDSHKVKKNLLLRIDWKCHQTFFRNLWTGIWQKNCVRRLSTQDKAQEVDLGLHKKNARNRHEDWVSILELDQSKGRTHPRLYRLDLRKLPTNK